MMDVKIASTGTYLPKTIVSTQNLLHELGIDNPDLKNSSGVHQRHVASDALGETTSQMAAWAILDALQRANLKSTDLDLILFASAAFEQPVPDTAVLVQQKLGLSSQGTPGFSIHATCLGFLQALDVASAFIQSKRYKCIAIVCSEIASKAINPNDPSSYVLFGDAAAAAIITPKIQIQVQKVQIQVHRPNLHSYMTTFGEASHYTEIIAGGNQKASQSSSLVFIKDMNALGETTSQMAAFSLHERKGNVPDTAVLVQKNLHSPKVLKLDSHLLSSKFWPNLHQNTDVLF